MPGWTFVRAHIWPDERGNPVLRHTKYLTPRGVAFPWEHRLDFGNGTKPRWYNGDGKDDGIVHPLLYRRDVFAQTSRDTDVLLVEGERDQATAQAHGLVAFTAGAALDFKREHARLFTGWRGRITIVRDNDKPGAVGAIRTYDVLRAVGIDWSQVRIARGRVTTYKADLTNHFDGGWGADELVPESVAEVRQIASTATPDDFTRAGYDRPPRYDGDDGWVHVDTDQSAQLSGWKPGRKS